MNFKPFSISILVSIFVFSCSDKKEEPIENESISEIDSTKMIDPVSTSKFPSIESNSTLNQWIAFYQKENPEMVLENFDFQNAEKLETMKGNVKESFEPGFDKVYLPFLIYNKSKTMYLDLDSYNWVLDQNGTAMFEADQEVDLVNLNDKSVKRIGFYGPSYWVEDGFWVTDSAFVLLQNSDENLPSFQVVNLQKDSTKTYVYKSPLKVHEEFYNDLRLRKNGVKVLQ